jgi:membrane protein implicated in regulation of membrane protease activity
VSAIGSLVVGVAAAAMARAVIARASRAGASGTVRSADLVGRTADVIVPFAGTATGKIQSGPQVVTYRTAEHSSHLDALCLRTPG